MTLDELNKIDVNDPAQVKALQNFLKSRGYYSKGIDGKWGGDTIEAVKSLRTDIQTESGNRTRTAEAGAEAEKAKSSWGRYAQEVGPWAGGGATGVLTGYLAGRKGTHEDKALTGEMREALANKRNAPAVTERTMDRNLSRRNWRFGKTAAAGSAGLLAAEVTRRYLKPQMSEELKPAMDIAASAEQGFGAAASMMALKNLAGDAFGKSPIPADVEAEIRSRAADARGDPYTASARAKAATPVPDGPDPERMAELRAKRVTDLRKEAKAAGVAVSGTKDDLARRIASAPPPAATAKPKRLPKAGLLAPFAAGAIAYDAVMGDAEAANADVAGYATERLGSGDTLARFEDVYSDYSKYARARGENPIPERAFRRQLTEQGITLARVGGADRVVASLNAGEYVGKAAAEAPSRVKAAAAGAGAAGLTAGVAKLAPYAANAISKSALGRVALRAVPPAAAALTAYDVGNYVAKSATPAPENDAFAEQYAKTHPRFDPDTTRTAQMSERQAARMPLRSAASLELPKGDDFDAMLADFVRAVEEHNSGVGGEQAYGP